MKLLCFFEEVKTLSPTEITDSGFVIFDTDNGHIHDFIGFKDFDENDVPEIIPVSDDVPIFKEVAYFHNEVPNPNYEEDEDGNPLDEDELPYIEESSDLLVYPMVQNILHMLRLKPIVFHKLRKTLLRHNMQIQAKNIEHLAAKFEVKKQVPDYGEQLMTMANAILTRTPDAPDDGGVYFGGRATLQTINGATQEDEER